MEHEEIQKKAKKKVEAKKGFFIVAMIFGAVSIILTAISFIIDADPFTQFWILFPILIFGLVLGIMYFSIFGIPGTNVLTEEWEDAELNREMNRLYHQQGIQLPPDTELSEEDQLELKELDRLKQKWEDRNDFV